MATTIINPSPTQESSSSAVGFVLGVILIIAFIALLFYFGLPYIQNGFGGGATQVNIPDKINVDVQNEK